MTTPELIHAILVLLFTSMLGASCGLFSYFLDYCTWEGSIFKDYLPRLARWVLKVYKQDLILRLKLDKEQHDQVCIDTASKYALFKILGGCMFCANVWVCLALFPLFNLFLLHSSWFLVAVFIATSHLALRKINPQ